MDGWVLMPHVPAAQPEEVTMSDSTHWVKLSEYKMKKIIHSTTQNKINKVDKLKLCFKTFPKKTVVVAKQ